MNSTNSTTEKDHPLPISTTSSLHTTPHHTPIYLNLYDLGGCNNTCTHTLGLTFYHCAVQTHSTEYGYMGHPYRLTGVYKTSKHDSRFHLYQFRQSIEMGWTMMNEKDIDQLVNGLKPFYMGFDYDTIKKNSIHFAKYLLEQLSLKHHPPMQIIHIPFYVERIRRFSESLTFLKMFDTEKDIAEINILYSLYMKSQGNLKQICQSLQIDTLDKLKRMIELIEQGIRQRKLPMFTLFTTFDLSRSSDYLSETSSNDHSVTLTEIFHQFDTITLRGRTSIDKHLNNPSTGPLVSHIPRSSQPQSISQNQGQTPLTSPSPSTISGSSNHKRTIIPIGTLRRFEHGGNSFSIVSHQRKLPRDLELNTNLYKLKAKHHLPPIMLFHPPSINLTEIDRTHDVLRL